jgi:hypothetical protein
MLGLQLMDKLMDSKSTVDPDRRFAKTTHLRAIEGLSGDPVAFQTG